MKILKATCDRILARLAPSIKGEQVLGGIVIPAEVARNIDRKGLVELEIVSAGPDCKVARPGQYVLVAKAVCQPIEYDGAEYMVFSEVTAIAIIETKADAPGEPAIAIVEASKLTIGEIRKGLNIPEKPTDDQSAVPAEPAHRD